MKSEDWDEALEYFDRGVIFQLPQLNPYKIITEHHAMGYHFRKPRQGCPPCDRDRQYGAGYQETHDYG